MHNLEESAPEARLRAEIAAEVQRRFAPFEDPAHNWEHVKRVYDLALMIAAKEGADPFIVGVAALLHDLGRLEEREDTRHHAERSVISGAALLEAYGVSPAKREPILHAVRAHSYKRGVEPQSLEAAVVRDADRLDALGAVGIMRWAVSTSKRHGIRNYDLADPFAEQRTPDEHRYMLDRFFSKLLKLGEGMLTATGRVLAEQRLAFMRVYLEQFRRELELRD